MHSITLYPVVSGPWDIVQPSWYGLHNTPDLRGDRIVGKFVICSLPFELKLNQKLGKDLIRFRKWNTVQAFRGARKARLCSCLYVTSNMTVDSGLNIE